MLARKVDHPKQILVGMEPVP